MANDDEGIGLADAIDQVRTELVRAIESGKDSPVRFRAGAVELEFEVVISRTREGSGGIRVWVVSAGGKLTGGESATHRVKTTLTPVDVEGNDQLIGSVGTQ